MSAVPEGLRVVLYGFMIFSPDGSFDGQGAAPHDGEVYNDLGLAKSIAEREWRGPVRRRDLRGAEWHEVPGLHRWELKINYGPPVSARPSDSHWYIDGVRVLARVQDEQPAEEQL